MNDLQKGILDIFKIIDKLCEKHNIIYYAIGGTCLGAVRHGGFIPWDDDLDIAIPIEQFEDFICIAKRELPDKFRVIRDTEVKHYGNIFIKISNEHTAHIEEVDKDYQDAFHGIFVDIMPLAGIPVKKFQRMMYVNRIKYYRMMNDKKRFPFRVRGKRTLFSKIMWRYCRVLYNAKPYTYFSDKWLNLLKKFPVDDAQEAGYVWSNLVGKLSFPAKCFGNGKRLKFEDTTIMCPENPEEFLKIMFDDYMKLPPLEKQTGHHTGIIDLNTSYKIYLEKSHAEKINK